MGWIVTLTLVLFYALGVVVFHAKSVRILPLVALLVFICDRWLIWKYGKRSSPQR